MKKIKGILLMLGCLIILAGCSNETGSTSLSSESTSVDAEETVENTNKSIENAYPLESEQVSKVSSQGDIIEITEKMYITYINDIYTNLEQYKGKKIKLEGMFTSQYDESVQETFYFVYRRGPGCCGNDGSMAGFEFTTKDSIPQENDWIEVTGTLDSYEQDGFIYLTLRDSQVVIKEERGLEDVYQ